MNCGDVTESRQPDKKSKKPRERRVVIANMSSDESSDCERKNRQEEKSLADSYSRRAQKVDMVVTFSGARLFSMIEGSSFVFQVKALAEKLAKKSDNVKVEAVRNADKNQSNTHLNSTYLSPWSESIATTGMPKIPKIKKSHVSSIECKCFNPCCTWIFLSVHLLVTLSSHPLAVLRKHQECLLLILIIHMKE